MHDFPTLLQNGLVAGLIDLVPPLVGVDPVATGGEGGATEVGLRLSAAKD